jgi:hypothetical protein
MTATQPEALMKMDVLFETSTAEILPKGQEQEVCGWNIRKIGSQPTVERN